MRMKVVQLLIAVAVSGLFKVLAYSWRLAGRTYITACVHLAITIGVN